MIGMVWKPKKINVHLGIGGGFGDITPLKSLKSMKHPRIPYFTKFPQLDFSHISCNYMSKIAEIVVSNHLGWML